MLFSQPHTEPPTALGDQFDAGHSAFASALARWLAARELQQRSAALIEPQLHEFLAACLWCAETRSKKGKSACGVYLPDLDNPRPPDLSRTKTAPQIAQANLWPIFGRRDALSDTTRVASRHGRRSGPRRKGRKRGGLDRPSQRCSLFVPSSSNPRSPPDLPINLSASRKIAAIPVLAGNGSSRPRPCQNSAKFSDRPRGAKISIISSSLDGLRARKSERNRSV